MVNKRQKHGTTGKYIEEVNELRASGMTWPDIVEDLHSRHGVVLNTNTLKSAHRRYGIEGVDIEESEPKQAAPKQEQILFKDEHEIMADGSQRNTTLLELNEAQQKDESYMLRAHGFDPELWDVVKVKNSRWNQHNKVDKTVELFASRLEVKPKSVILKAHSIIERMNEVKPRTLNRPTGDVSSAFYVLALYDEHFGINTYEDYEPTLNNIVEELQKETFEEVLITIGSDMFHHNDHRNRTASGREIEQVDMTQAWSDASDFYGIIIEEALKNSKNVQVVYVKGNHDESLSWAFTKMLEAKYPQAEFDDEFEERKAFMLGTNFIGLTHGDKSRKVKYPGLFSVEFPDMFAAATNRDIFVGHLHNEHTLDEAGFVIRQTPT